MHEHSFIQSIIKNVEDKDNVQSITLEVGELAGIEANHLEEHLKKETFWPDIICLTKKALVKCDCGYEGSPKIRQRLHDLVIFECENCGNIPEVLGGKDIKILNITYN